MLRMKEYAIAQWTGLKATTRVLGDMLHLGMSKWVVRDLCEKNGSFTTILNFSALTLL
jgi:hypothetical protein